MFKLSMFLMTITLACSTAFGAISQTEFNRLVDELGTPDRMLRTRAKLIGHARSNPQWLVSALSVQSGERAKQLAFVAGAARIEPAYDTLVKLASQSGAVALREQCIVAIGQLKLEKSLPKLKSFLSDTNPKIRASATTALGRTMQSGAIPILAQLLSDADKEVSEQAKIGVRIIGRGKSTAVAAEMQALLTSPTLPKMAIIAAIQNVTQNKLPQENIRNILTDSKFSPPVRVEAAKALAKNPTKENEAALITNTTTSDASVLVATYDAIGEIGTMDSATLLVRRLSGLKGKTAIAAASAAGDILLKYRDETYKTGFNKNVNHRMLNQLIAKLQKLLGNRDNAVRRAAVIALGKAKNKTAMDALIETMRDDSSPESAALKKEAHKALQNITGKTYIRRADPSTWESAKNADLPEEERLTDVERIEEFTSPAGGSKTTPVIFEPPHESSGLFYLGAGIGVIFIGFLFYLAWRSYVKRAELIEKSRRKIKHRSLDDDYY